VVCGNEKAGAGVLSGMVFLLPRTTRTRQRWRDGEGASGFWLMPAPWRCRDKENALLPLSNPRSGNRQTGKTKRRSRPRSKKRRGDATPAPFCRPSLKVMDADLDLCGGIYPKGARHNGLLCEPDGRAAPCPARALCIRRRYVGCRHTQQPAQPTTHCQNDVRARHVQTTLAPAACERRALDGVAASCEAMKRDGVKRLRQRRETSLLQRASRWRFYAFGALSDTTALAKARGLRVLLQAPWLCGQVQHHPNMPGVLLGVFTES